MAELIQAVSLLRRHHFAGLGTGNRYGAVTHHA